MNTQIAFRSALAASGLAALALPALPAQAQRLVLEEIIVTAQKREESLQDVPVSVSAVSGQQIIEQGLGNLEEMSIYVPNLTINETPGASQIFIRGLGSGDNAAFEQSVGLFIDGIYAGRARQFRAPFLDVASVEVLRGPQGTLFGKNTIAGAITVTTERPTDELEAILRTAYEVEYDDFSVDGILSGPITDSLSGRLAIRHSDAEGYFDNTKLSRDEVDADSTVLRGSLLWHATEDLSVFFKYEDSETELDGKSSRTDEAGGWEDLIRAADPKYSDDVDKRSTNTVESSDTDAENATLQLDWALGEYELTSITGYSEYQYDDLVDADTTAIDLSAFAPSQDFEQWSQELRLTSPVGDSIDFIAGFYYQENELDVQRNLGVKPQSAVGGPGVNPAFGLLSPFGFQGDYSQDADTWAVFGSVTWHATDRLHINAGLRYTDESKDAERSLFYTGYLSSTPLDEVYPPETDPALNALTRNAAQFIGIYEHEIADDRSADDWSPTLRISWDYTDDIMFYASASEAFKSGGFNEAGSTGDDPGEYPPEGNPASFEFDDEEATAFEVGGKMRLFDSRATLNFAAFYTEFDELQVSTFQGDSFVVGNAATATSRGVEVDGMYLLSEAFTLSGSLAWLDAEYDDFPNAPCTVAQELAVADAGGDPANCRQDLSGEELPFAPEWTSVLALAYQEEFGEFLVSGQVDTVYTSSQYLAGDLDPQTKEGSNTLYNARVALGSVSNSWEVALVGRNITDEEVRTFVNDPFLLDGLFFAYMAPPRTIELQLNLRY